MNVALVMLVSIACLWLGYRFYSQFVASQLGINPKRKTPAHQKNDGIDYVPTNPFVLFGHHYASIAAAGPIVGPALALYFGFVPAWLWIILGVIFIGAVHDFTALYVAVREGGHSLAEVARKTLGKPGFVFYVAFAIFVCLLVIAAFLQLTSIALTSKLEIINFENITLAKHLIHDGKHIQIGGCASTSVIIMTLLAPVLGFLIYRKNIPVTAATGLAIIFSVTSIAVGYFYPVTIDPVTWIWLIVGYVFVASWIPVWVVLQPRDFINVQILFIGLLTMVSALLVMGLYGVQVSVPAFNLKQAMTAPNLGLVWPFLFITIACGAASGAHGLICGGTSCKQVANEKHTRPIGYGGMLLEALLAICVILVLSGGMDFNQYVNLVYPEIGRSNAPLAFALGLGNSFHVAFKLPVVLGTIWGILLLEGFLVTTIDALVRLTRYLFEELWTALIPRPHPLLKNRVVNSLIVVGAFLTLTFGNTYLKIWPIFGASNQLLAALTLIAVTAWLAKNKKKILFTALPAIFMVITTVTTLGAMLVRYWQAGDSVLMVSTTMLIVLALGMVSMAVQFFKNNIKQVKWI